MANYNSNKRKLYDALSKDYDMGTYEQFCSDLNDEKKRRKLFDATSKEYDLGTYDSFNSQLGYYQQAVEPAKAPTAQPTAKEEAPKAQTTAQPKRQQYFKLRRGGQDFTVSTDEVNAAGGLGGWAKAHPGAPIRTYMHGEGFGGHVDLSQAHNRLNTKGYKYTLVDKPIEQKAQEPWNPTEQEKIRMSAQIEQIRRRGEESMRRTQQQIADFQEYQKKSRGRFGQAVESTPTFNPETGKLEKTYLTPTGDRVNSKAVADAAAYSFRRAYEAADMSVGAQIRRGEAELADLKKQLEGSTSRVHKEWAEDYEKDKAPLAAVLYSQTYVPRQQGDKENAALRAAIRQKEEMLKDLYEERDRQMGKDVGFWRGFGRVAGDIRTWDFGVGDLTDAMTMMNHQQYTSPNATEGEKKAGQAMMKAAYDRQQVEQMYGGNASFWNRAGVMTGYMPSFMVDFALTGGGFEAIEAAGKLATRGAAKVFTKEALKEMSELGLKAYVKKYGAKGAAQYAGNWTIKALGTTADELLIRAPLMTNTVQGLDTAADIINRKLGNVVIDANGNYDYANDKTWGSAVWQAEANSIIENFSEMFGTHLDGALPAIANALGGKRISGMLARANASSYGQILATTRKQFERLGVSDYFGEVAEEYYGQLWRTMLNLDDAYTQEPVFDKDGNPVLDAEGNQVYERKNLLATGQFHGDIWGGMALSMGLMGAGKYTISAAAYGAMKHDVNKADSRASSILTAERWEPMRTIIDNTSNDDMGALAEQVVNDQNMTDEERAAVMEYMERSMNLRGYNLGQMAQSRGADDVETPDPMEDFNQSWLDGYNARSPQEMADAQNQYEYQLSQLQYLLEADQIEALDTNPVNELQTMLQSGLYDDSVIDAARDYINAKFVRDGIMQAVADNTDELVEASNATIRARINNTSGMIQPATMKADDRPVYIVGGNIVANPDRTIDHQASDESVVIRDAATGAIEFTDPRSIFKLDEAVDPQAEMDETERAISEQADRSLNDSLNGTLQFNPGDVYSFPTQDGTIEEWTLIGPALDENMVPIQGQYIMQTSDGQQYTYNGEDIQYFSDQANIARLSQFEQERARARAEADVTDQEESRPKYALNDEFSLRIPDTGQVVRGSVTAEENEDGLVEIYTEDAVGGNKVHMYTPEQLNAMVETYNGQPWAGPKADESVQNSEESVPKTPKNGSIFEETEQNGTETVHEPPERVQQSALERVPVDANGNPMFEEVDADTAWDAIVEQTQGDEEIAAEVVADIIAEKKTDLDAAEKALKKTQEAKPDKRKPGDPVPTMAERIAIKTVSKQALAEGTEIRDTAKAILDHWTKIAETTMRRKQEAEAARLAQEAIERKKRAEEAAAAKAAQEEADRIEREALNGVPDWNVDTPTDARARGYRRYGPKKVDRQAPINNKVEGKEVEVKFGDDVMPKGRQVVIDASELQPSHRDGQRNPAHFLDEAQPKERKDAASRFAADKIAANIRPEEVTSAVTAYTGAPTINARGEVIQGNNRSEALRIMYEKYADSAAKYKQYLIDHAAEFGMTPEQIAQIEQPVLTTMLDVSDEDAITYGQYVAQDTESGGIERIKPKNAVKKMGEDIRTFANLLLRSSDDEASFAQLVDANGIEVLKWMSQKGYITDTQYQSAFDSKGNLNAEASNDLKGIMYQSIFTGGTTRLEEMFNNLPAKAQRAILATAYRDHDSAFGERMITEIQQSIIAYNAIMSYESFVNAKNYKDALLAVESWKHQYAFDDVSGESYLPAEAFSNFALTLVAAYKGRTQRDIQSTFNAMYDIVQGTVQPTLFDPNPDTTPKPLAEAIKSVLEIDYQPVVKQTNNDNGTNGSDNVDGSPEESEEGRPGSAGTTDYAERSEETAESPDGGAGAAGDSRAAGDGRNAVGQSDISPTSEAEEISYQLSDEVDEYGKPLVLAKDGSTTFGTIDSDSGLTEAPIRLSLGENTTDDNGANHGYGLLHIEAGHGDQIRNAGYASVEEFVEEVAKNYTDIREGALIGDNQTYLLEVSDEHNNTLFIQLSKDDTYWNVNSAGIFKKKYSRRKPKVYSVPAVGDGISTDTTEVNSGQSKGATAPAGNSSQTSEDKVTTSSEEKQADERESSVGARVAAAEAEVDTNPTDAQKEAGNYKKGHVQVGTFDVSIENPAGSVRRGVDADGKAWATTMHNTYGYIRGTVGVDGDQIDVYLSDHIDGWNGARVFVIDVYNPDGTFDEHKVMLGFNDKEDALFDFTANYDIDWVKARRIEVHSVLMDDFEKWVESSKRKTKPFGEYTIAKKSAEGRSLDGLNQRLEEIEQSVYDDTVRQIEEAVGKPGAIPNIKRMKAHIAELGKQIKALERGLPYVQSDADLVKIQENVARVAGEQKAYKAKLAEFEAKIAEVEKQAEGTTADTDNGYTIDEYTTKSGKKYQRVVLPRVDKTVWQQRLNLAKKMGGISVPKGYGFKTWEEAEAFAQAVISPDTVANTQPLSLDDMRQAVEEAPAAPTTEAEQQLVQQPEAEKPVNPSGNRLVTDERYAQLRERMRRKLGGQLNMGIDPEILAIGTEMAVYHIEKGVRRFTEYAKAMIADLGDAIRPYLKSFYNAVRDMPEAQSIGLVDEMDAYDDVSRVDIAKFDKTSTDAMATAAAVVAEHEAESQRAEAEEKLKEKRKKRRESESKPTIDGGLFDNAEADAAPALVDTEKGDKTRGNLISFSTIDGETRQGILMGENFKLTDLRNSVPLSSRLAQIRDGVAVSSENGDVEIERIGYGWQHRGDFELRVPKSKQRGGVYTMNHGLLKHIDGNNFVSKGNHMIGYISPENLAKVLDMLSHEPFNVTVLQKSKLAEVKDEDLLLREGEETESTDIKAVNERFNRELQQQAEGTLPVGHIYQIGHPGAILRAAGFPDMPIELSSTRLSEKAAQENHIFDIEEVRNLVKEMNTPWAVFRYGNNAKNVIIGIEHNDKQFLVSVHFNQNRGGMEVSSIRGIFPKDNAEWLNWISQGKAEYLNKEKIQTLIDQQRINLADVAYLDLDDVAKVINSFENPTIEGEESLGRQGDGYGAYSDEEVSYANDPTSKLLGKNRFSKKRQAEFAARERQRMADRVQELAERMNLDNVEIVTDASQLEGKRAKAKGFYNKRSGKITIVIPNNVSTIDAEQTLLHEAVAHYGLRQLFGAQFETFLDNVYESADPAIRRKIAEMAAKNGWDFRTATEDYLAGLAEDTDFNEARSYGGWWSQIKRLFLDMLEKIGFAGFRDKAGVILSDNELRYILWRSYQNLAEPGRYRSILGEASDVAKQSQLKVGNYAEHGIEANYAAEGDGLLDEISLKFDQELEAYENRQLPTGHRFELGMPSRYLRSAGFPNLPISMRSSLLARKAGDERHPFEASDLKGLVDAIQRPIAIFEYTKPNMRNLIVDLRRGDKHFLVGVTLNYKAGEVEINSVSGLFPKESHEWVKWIQDGKAIRIDQKEKVQAIIDSLRTNPAESERIGLNLDGAAKIVNSFENPTVEEEGLFRPGDFSPRDRALIRHKYEEMVRSGGYQFKEAVQDSMLGLKKLYQAILGRSTRIEDVPGFENAYLFENRMSSMNAGEQHEYFRRYMQPLLQEIGRIVEANSRKRRELTDYIMAKHGLERNEYMRAEAAKNGEDTDRDFAGLMGLTGEADWRAAEATAQQWVDDYESMHDTAALWEAVNKATKATLEKVYLAGIISKETYEKILDMYEYYVPLRGWNETTSEEVYGYLTSKDGPLGGSIMKKAEGRSSMADDPIATIGMMADDAIRQGNRNLMKQRFLNFVLNHPSDAVSVHDIWLEYDDVADEWRPVFADVEATDTADEVAQKVEDFEQRMEELRKDHPDKYKKGREAQNIPYKVVRGNLREHQILIKKNGRTFVATINGNPRAAQALNGLTNPDVDQNGVVGNMLKAGTWINRQLSAFYTTRNPDFVVSNFFRDMLYSNCMTWVKESPRYALRFHKNFGRVNPVVMRRLLGKWENGTLDMNNRLESLFYQFMRNGGETGYTNVRDIEGHKRTVAKELKKQGSAGRRAWAALGMQLDLLNRSVENCARFAAFITSRDFGRSIDRAIYDAKEISVNFNKKGSGGKMVNAVGQKKLGKFGSYLGGGGRIAYVFWNAGIQGMTNALRQGKRHPYKFTAGASALFALGYVIPLLAQMLGGGDGDDDDKNAYYNLPEYVRRSNICFRAGGQWITIPLPIEYRAMYGMGELCCGTVTGNERYSDKELTRQMLAQFSQLFPLDMLEGGGGVSPLIPSALKPYTEAYIMNKGWTGLPVYKDTPFNKNAPEWTKAYASADQHLVDFTRWLNETTGGDQFTKGAIDINPAKIEYLLNGTFGGLFTFPNKIKKTGETMFGDREFDWRSIPIANRLIKTGDERTANRKLQNEYFKYKEEYEQTQGRLRNYESEADKGDDAMQDKADLLFNSPQGMRYQIFDEFKADLDAYREDIAAETDKEMRAQLEAEMYQLMRELVNALHDPETYINQSAQQ